MGYTTDASPTCTTVLAPFVLDTIAAGDMLCGIGTAAELVCTGRRAAVRHAGAGSLPELVNRNADWLAQVQHLPTIMAMGTLAGFAFWLAPCLMLKPCVWADDAETLWQDVAALCPSLPTLSDAERSHWRVQTQTALMRACVSSIEIVYGQVWQPTVTAKSRLTAAHRRLNRSPPV